MLRPLGLACLSVSLAACASLLGDFDVVPDSTNPDASSSSSGGIDGGGEGGVTPDGGGGTDGGADAGAQPDPLEVAVNQFATCATVRYASGPKSFCWGAASPEIRQYLGAAPGDVPVGAGFFAPHTAGGNPLLLDKIFGTGSGSWFIASGTDVQGAPDALSWGSNLNTQSGQGVTPATAPNVLPARLKRATPAGGTQNLKVTTTASGGPRHGCVIEDSKLYCWGQNDSCQSSAGNAPLCVTNQQPVRTPQLTNAIVPAPPGIEYDAVAAGEGHTCIVAHEPGGGNQATAYCFGDNTQGQAGADPFTLQYVGAAQPVKGVGTGSAQQMEIAAGDRHTCVIARGNKLMCWGANAALQVAPGGDTSPKGPTEVAGNAITGDLSQLRLAGTSTCVVAGLPNVKSRIFCFGSGELGRDNATAGVAPVAGLDTIKRFSLSNTHGCAIASPIGSNEVGLYCWGSNAAKAVDPGSTEGRFATPHRVLFPPQ